MALLLSVPGQQRSVRQQADQTCGIPLLFLICASVEWNRKCLTHLQHIFVITFFIFCFSLNKTVSPTRQHILRKSSFQLIYLQRYKMGLLVHGGTTCITTDLNNRLLIGHQLDNEAVWTYQVHETSLFSLKHLRNYWFRKTTHKTNKQTGT